MGETPESHFTTVFEALTNVRNGPSIQETEQADLRDFRVSQSYIVRQHLNKEANQQHIQTAVEYHSTPTRRLHS